MLIYKFMPGYVIHLAIGKVYEKKNEIKNIKDFEKGIIAPDMTDNKSKTHYGPYSSMPNFNKYIIEHGINNEYDKGYLLHLISDYLYYNYFLKKWDNKIYNDYDILNKKIMEKYELTIPEEIKKYAKFKDGELTWINEKGLYKFIEYFNKINLEQIVKKKSDEEIKKELTDNFLDYIKPKKIIDESEKEL